ncbi:MAG: YqaJ viral recombinase family protein [Hyphomicrobiales bacterium]|nr:YqaJ viral recombinase family protein [Hyphomicrobiales bacterium]
MRVIDFPQGSDEWKLARCTKVTASRIDAVLSRARDRKSEGATRRKYKAQIVAEILSGMPQESRFSNKAMEDGIQNEPFARAAYDVAKNTFVEQVGLVLHPTIERSGASPDGLVGTDGLVQFKCPEPHTHLGYVLDGVVPPEYEPQMLWEMACTERKWCDFASYCDVFPQHQLFVVRFNRDEQRIREITAEVNVFLSEVDEIIERLNRKAA